MYASQSSNNILDNHLPGLLARARQLEAQLQQGCSRSYAATELNKLEAYWSQLQELAVRQGVYPGAYDHWVGPLTQSLTRSKDRIEAMVVREQFWGALLDSFIGVANKVLRFFRMPEIPRRLLTAASHLLLPPARRR